MFWYTIQRHYEKIHKEDEIKQHWVFFTHVSHATHQDF